MDGEGGSLERQGGDALGLEETDDVHELAGEAQASSQAGVEPLAQLDPDCGRNPSGVGQVAVDERQDTVRVRGTEQPGPV